MTLIVSPNLLFISSLIFLWFVSLSVISLNIFNTLSKVGIDVREHMALLACLAHS